jgi:hypothetical protein
MIAVLNRCNFPISLRLFEACYYFIGECYVGVMDGELMEAKERGEYHEVEISLC